MLWVRDPQLAGWVWSRCDAPVGAEGAAGQGEPSPGWDPVSIGPNVGADSQVVTGAIELWTLNRFPRARNHKQSAPWRWPMGSVDVPLV